MKNKNKSWKVINDEASKWARWIALYEAVNLIADKAEEKNISLDNIIFSPLDIRDYMDSTEDIILRKILNQEYNIDIAYNEVKQDTEEYQFI